MPEQYAFFRTKRKTIGNRKIWIIVNGKEAPKRSFFNRKLKLASMILSESTKSLTEEKLGGWMQYFVAAVHQQLKSFILICTTLRRTVSLLPFPLRANPLNSNCKIDSLWGFCAATLDSSCRHKYPLRGPDVIIILCLVNNSSSSSYLPIRPLFHVRTFDSAEK